MAIIQKGLQWSSHTYGALSRNLCCQNIYASMSKYIFMIVVNFHLKCSFHSAKSWKDTKKTPVKITFRDINILQMLMLHQWWLPHAKNYIKLNGLNPQTITCLGSTQDVQRTLYKMKIHPWLLRSSTKSFYFGS